MGERIDALQALVQNRADELGITSTRELTRRAKGQASYESIRRIQRGLHDGQLSDRVAEGLAAALELPVDRIRDAAGLPRTAGHWDWPPQYDVLDPGERRLVESFAAALVAARSKG